MYIGLDLPEQEIGFANAIKALLSLKYKPFGKAEIKKHC